MSSINRAAVETTTTTSFINSADYSFWQKALMCVVGSVILTLSAKVIIPCWPVNATLQTLALVGLGVTYGRHLAVLSVLLYLTEGACGLPVFTGTPIQGLGLAYMVGPSGGFLLGFVAMAYVAGLMYETGWGRTWVKAAVLCLLANLVLYVPGTLWMSFWVGSQATLANVMLWIPGFFAKMGLAVALLVQLSSLKASAENS